MPASPWGNQWRLPGGASPWMDACLFIEGSELKVSVWLVVMGEAESHRNNEPSLALQGLQSSFPYWFSVAALQETLGFVSIFEWKSFLDLVHIIFSHLFCPFSSSFLFSFASPFFLFKSQLYKCYLVLEKMDWKHLLCVWGVPQQSTFPRNFWCSLTTSFIL